MNSGLGEQQLIKGRVLTRHALHKQGVLVLQYYIQTESGPIAVELFNQEHVCFVQSSDEARLFSCAGLTGIRPSPVALKSFNQAPVSALYCGDGRLMRTLIRAAKDLDIELFESDVKAEHRFLIERFIALDVEFYGQFVERSAENSFSSSSSHSLPQSQPLFVASRARLSTSTIKLNAISLDFECSFSGELYSVGLYGQTLEGGVYQKVIMVGQPEETEQDYIEWVSNEYELIIRLIEWFQEYDPDIIIGWSVVTFDLALLYRRAKYHGIALNIGRDNQPLGWKVEDKYRPETLSLPGRVVLDGIDWLKAAFYQFERYSLEFVSQALLDEGKAIHNVDNRMGEIKELFFNDKPALAHYNLTDCRLVWDIFEKTHLFDFAIERAKLTGLELGRVGASVAAFNNLYLPHLHRAGYVAPSKPVSDGIESPGGYVMDSVPGLYRHILVLDFKSLYPSIIRTFLIDPKGLVEGLNHGFSQQPSKTVPGFLGAQFSREKPILPMLIKNLSEQREQAKQNHDAPLSQAIKIIMNSLYGVLGSKGCVFHDARLASSITMRGHEIMKQTRRWIEAEGYEVIYGDTDSTFVWLGNDFEQAEVQQTGKALAQKVNQFWVDKLNSEFQLESFLELEFETHFEQFFMPTLRGSVEGSKKRYVGTKLNRLGQPELIFKGMEQVRSDWSPLARRVQYELYERLFQQQDVESYLRETVDKLTRGELNKELVFAKQLRRDLEEYTAKSAPHLKAARKLCDATGDPQYGKRGARVEYVMTLNGAEPVQHTTASMDYNYYLSRQLEPIAEPILSILKTTFSQVTTNQMSLI
ncbi:DNA polymerase II [Shewanella schlegeliana]|uniref:DNA polymerase n=1 Tax=Shewanella schlegeliana TaxID=190308 RepID=A0ABS1T0Z9_9GAMM|nr:DNA polymerase II [Shewanella schlegeliana]MBL4913221.1 DNA polymerase II [Shewanella schlegeliana]MCL1109176.1 DNA polymerase II [Shewanella schlegeliana]GIU24228.1 DNA polymerase [Shewanella schlegeliana]